MSGPRAIARQLVGGRWEYQNAYNGTMMLEFGKIWHIYLVTYAFRIIAKGLWTLWIISYLHMRFALHLSIMWSLRLSFDAFSFSILCFFTGLTHPYIYVRAHSKAGFGLIFATILWYHVLHHNIGLMLCDTQLYIIVIFINTLEEKLFHHIQTHIAKVQT